MLKRRTAVGVMILMTCVLCASASPAIAGNWAPNGATVVGDSTTFLLAVRRSPTIREVVTCGALTISGTTNAGGSPEWTATPTLLECNTTPTIVGTWTIKDENATTAKLVIPPGGSIAVTLTAMGGCTVTLGPQTLGAPGEYVNGTTGRGAGASRWRLLQLTPTFTALPAGCATNVELSTRFIMNNFTANTAITVS